MAGLETLYEGLGFFYEPLFMRRAMVALFLLSLAVSGAGVLAVSRRLAFFPDAIGHSSLAGLALGLLVGLDPKVATLLFGLVLGLMIVFLAKRIKLSADVSLALVFSGAVALGLALVSRDPVASGGLARWFMGDVLTTSDQEIAAILALDLVAALVFLLFYNQLILSAVFPAGAYGRVFLDYLFGAFLAAVSILAVQAVGALLATALLVTPAATARALAVTGRAFFWLALTFSLVAGQLGLWISYQPGVNASAGATIVLTGLVFLILASLYRRYRDRPKKVNAN
ncbi:MAG: metal ABC transporter permease [Deltaproteobacteria bacterium]|jgi:zinc transport system permease protein|nr:metal ABC transporter permease [Deltaproteobacteria bacterium]